MPVHSPWKRSAGGSSGVWRGSSQEIEHGDVASNARELAEVARRLERTDDDLTKLRGLLSRLRRYADDVRVGSPAA